MSADDMATATVGKKTTVANRNNNTGTSDSSSNTRSNDYSFTMNRSHINSNTNTNTNTIDNDINMQNNNNEKNTQNRNQSETNSQTTKQNKIDTTDSDANLTTTQSNINNNNISHNKEQSVGTFLYDPTDDANQNINQSSNNNNDGNTDDVAMTNSKLDKITAFSNKFKAFETEDIILENDDLKDNSDDITDEVFDAPMYHWIQDHWQYTEEDVLINLLRHEKMLTYEYLWILLFLLRHMYQRTNISEDLAEEFTIFMNNNMIQADILLRIAFEKADRTLLITDAEYAEFKQKQANLVHRLPYYVHQVFHMQPNEWHKFLHTADLNVNLIEENQARNIVPTHGQTWEEFDGIWQTPSTGGNTSYMVETESQNSGLSGHQADYGTKKMDHGQVGENAQFRIDGLSGRQAIKLGTELVDGISSIASNIATYASQSNKSTKDREIEKMLIRKDTEALLTFLHVYGQYPDNPKTLLQFRIHLNRQWQKVKHLENIMDVQRIVCNTWTKALQGTARVLFKSDNIEHIKVDSWIKHFDETFDIKRRIINLAKFLKDHKPSKDAKWTNFIDQFYNEKQILDELLSQVYLPNQARYKLVTKVEEYEACMRYVNTPVINELITWLVDNKDNKNKIDWTEWEIQSKRINESEEKGDYYARFDPTQPINDTTETRDLNLIKYLIPQWIVWQQNQHINDPITNERKLFSDWPVRKQYKPQRPRLEHVDVGDVNYVGDYRRGNPNLNNPLQGLNTTNPNNWNRGKQHVKLPWKRERFGQRPLTYKQKRKREQLKQKQERQKRLGRQPPKTPKTLNLTRYKPHIWNATIQQMRLIKGVCRNCNKKGHKEIYCDMLHKRKRKLLAQLTAMANKQAASHINNLSTTGSPGKHGPSGGRGKDKGSKRVRPPRSGKSNTLGTITQASTVAAVDNGGTEEHRGGFVGNTNLIPLSEAETSNETKNFTTKSKKKKKSQQLTASHVMRETLMNTVKNMRGNNTIAMQNKANQQRKATALVQAIVQGTGNASGAQPNAQTPQ